MVDALNKIAIITKIAWHNRWGWDIKVLQIRRILAGDFLFYAVLPGTQKYVAVRNACNEFQATVALEEFGYDEVEVVVHEALWWFPAGFVEVDRIDYEE